MLIEISIDRANKDKFSANSYIINYYPLNTKCNITDFMQDQQTFVFSPSVNYICIRCEDNITILYAIKVIISHNDYDLILFKSKDKAEKYFKKSIGNSSKGEYFELHINK